ncbi:hypothetical protein [Nocardia sp. NPDC050435]|uniref:hypothetical protein n=1 Tax=Nocardia sp. NPDC050435 TaxID=3155040 RepID=UPI003403F598
MTAALEDVRPKVMLRKATDTGMRVRGISLHGEPVRGTVIMADAESVAVIPLGSAHRAVVKFLDPGSVRLDETTVETPRTIAQPWVMRALRRYEAEVGRLVTWRDQMAEDAREFADENKLCEEFDNFMEKWGMEGRERDYSATVSIEFTVTLEGSARSTDKFRDSITQERVEQEVSSYLRSYFDRSDWEIDDIES